MLNIGKLAHGGAEYYLTAVASSLEAYYTGAGEAPGRWLGAASGRLGLAGLVTAEALRTVLSGASPTDGRPLVGHARTVPGFDLTFRTPKSVSLLWALADGEVSREVRQAHDAAVVAALDYLERHAAWGSVRHARRWDGHGQPTIGVPARGTDHRLRRSRARGNANPAR